MGLYERVQEALAYIRGQTPVVPRFAIILGTGLGRLADEIDAQAAVEYPEIPYFVRSTVETHAGRLLVGSLGGQPVVAMSGRFHRYEGHSMQEITFPVRVMRAMGAQFLFISNVSGGMNPQFSPGELVIIEDHINLLGDNPLIGPNDERLGTRYPDMSAPYDRELVKLAKRIAVEERIAAHTGVYAALTGPSLETRAEYRFLRFIGADVVGMSTIPEVIVGVHAGFRILAVSVITDECIPDRLKPADIREIIAVANHAQGRLTTLFKRMVREAR